jgi:N6-adenosine-specific RNA methylase IME4
VPEFLEDGLKVLRAWGFRYKSSLVWTKSPAGYGRYWQQAHEVLLLGVRGNLPFRDIGLLSLLGDQETSPADMSRDIRELIERVSPSPYLELFGSHTATGWTLAEQYAVQFS